jgi:hypothetical protein
MFHNKSQANRNLFDSALETKGSSQQPLNTKVAEGDFPGPLTGAICNCWQRSQCLLNADR